MDVGERQLRAGVGAFAAHDHPDPGRPAASGQVHAVGGEQGGELGDVAAVAQLLAQHRQVADRLAAVGQQHRQVAQHPARVMRRPPYPSDAGDLGQCGVQPGRDRDIREHLGPCRATSINSLLQGPG